MRRYIFHGHFIEEQRKGFEFHHESQKILDTYRELVEFQDAFVSSYVPKYCYGLSIGISEEPSLVDD